MLEKLVKKAQNGDKDAFSELIIYYKDDLYRFARARLGGNEDDACDAVQETILVAYSSIGQLKKTSSFRSWIMRILVNKCNDIYRKNSLLETISYESNECEEYLVAPSVSDSKVEIESLMAVLTEKEKTIIVLNCVLGYNSKEISKMTDIKASTIRSKISRALDKMSKKDKGELKI